MNALERVRSHAGALLEVTEADHHGMTSFRVANRIFATVPDDDHVRVMVEEASIQAAIESEPGACAPFYWGKRLACVVVDVERIPSALFGELLEEAWLRRAPAALARHWSQLHDR